MSKHFEVEFCEESKMVYVKNSNHFYHPAYDNNFSLFRDWKKNPLGKKFSCKVPFGKKQEAPEIEVLCCTQMYSYLPFDLFTEKYHLL